MQDLRGVNTQLQKDLEEQGKRLSAAESDKDRFRQEAVFAQDQVCMCVYIRVCGTCVRVHA